LRFCFMHLRPIPLFLRDERWGCLWLASSPIQACGRQAAATSFPWGGSRK
jgi:hypothetical protein